MQFTFELAGLNFRASEAKAAVAVAEAGTRANLYREPHNEYDANAIQVHLVDQWTGDAVFVGYIPRHSNRDLAKIMDGLGADVGLVAYGHKPEITCTVLSPDEKKPIFLVEVTTGFEVETTVVETPPEGE